MAITREGHISGLLKDAAESEAHHKLVVYPLAEVSTPVITSYTDLYAQAQQYGQILQTLKGFQTRKPIIIYLDNHLEAITWFWAVVLADALPVPAPPFPNGVEDRRRYLHVIATLFGSPFCITREDLKGHFHGESDLRIQTVESLRGMAIPAAVESTDEPTIQDLRYSPNDTAVLMLTSGSTGDSKAVEIKHKQIWASVAGKASVRPIPPEKPLLNWIGLDHVANLLETHLLALYLNLDQIHVHAADMAFRPEIFLDLLSRHRVSRTFAPNFFLAKLVTATEGGDPDPTQYDLSSLEILISGGEANNIDTCVAITALLERYGAGPNALTPGFGMTETCAGAIYNIECPGSDLEYERSISSLGRCMEGIEMRVVEHGDGCVRIVSPGETGDLEVRGEAVFGSYYGQPAATKSAFSADGWFRTGDRAIVDARGNLNLVGRSKEVININSVKYSCAHIQACLEKAVGARVHRIVSFPSRAPKAPPEQVTVAFVMQSRMPNTEEMTSISLEIMRCCVLLTGSRPCVFSFQESSSLPISALGKISRVKMRSLFESGAFSTDLERHSAAMKSHTIEDKELSRAGMEAQLLDDLSEVLGDEAKFLGVDTSFFQFGFTSMDIIRLKRLTDRRWQANVSIATFMSNPTVRSLAAALGKYSSISSNEDQAEDVRCSDVSIAYDPVVTLKPHGSKAPLWLIHPGVGEVLVFVGLVQHLADEDRPVYALRARGFEHGQSPFTTIDEVVGVYQTAIQRRQPCGPYAIAGYSYGAMLAFEVAKDLESHGQKVQFLGNFNLPPHIKFRMRRLNLNMCLLHLTYFLGLTTESYSIEVEDQLWGMEYAQAIAQIREAIDQERLRDLGLGEQDLLRWAGLAYGLQHMAVDYEPAGLVDSIDIFHAIPLKAVSRSREDWVQNHLSKWAGFSRSGPRLHGVGGAHYTMLMPEYVAQFARIFKAALRARGI
ncbi:acetyl-CoA synthetase-like protein [Xylariaceae sp. FL0016]|nr:acetyl-CoA synthetase-like protein [Xylariaceae sp. FL0016]